MGTVPRWPSVLQVDIEHVTGLAGADPIAVPHARNGDRPVEGEPRFGFHRIRHYGLLAGGSRKASLALARELLGVATPPGHGDRADTSR